jgi:hypothetical protein
MLNVIHGEQSLRTKVSVKDDTVQTEIPAA